MGNALGSNVSKTENSQPPNGTGEHSRVLFLLYLIHRTWNVVVDSVDSIGKRSQASAAASEDSGAPPSVFDDSYTDDYFNNLDDQSTLYGSENSFCSCSYCFDPKANNTSYYARAGFRLSVCERSAQSKAI